MYKSIHILQGALKKEIQAQDTRWGIPLSNISSMVDIAKVATEALYSVVALFE